MVNVVIRQIPSPLGTLVAEASDRGLTRLHFANNEAPLAVRAGESDGYGSFTHGAAAALDLTCAAVRAYFLGQPAVLDNVPLDLTLTAFQEAVLRHTRATAFGQVVTYGDLARDLGCPGAARAVGSALAANPVLLVVPCHRIVPQSRGRGAGAGAGGYAGSTWRKEWLLQWEASEGTLGNLHSIIYDASPCRP